MKDNYAYDNKLAFKEELYIIPTYPQMKYIVI